MSKKLFLLLVMMSVFDTTSLASTVKWLIKPEYDAVSYYSENIFKCKSNGKWQLIDKKGVTLLPYAVDSITDCFGGYSLALEKTGDKYKIKGFFGKSTLQYIPVSGSYYTGTYSYFSEGYVPVADTKTMLFGYLDATGREVIPFKYSQARPFIRGLASVEPAKTKRQTIYIDKNGKTLSISGFNHDKIIIGSSFNQNGEALIAYYGDENAVINTDGKVVRQYERKDGKSPIRSFDFAFDESKTNYYPKQEITLSYNAGITTFDNDGLIGYKMGENTLAPAQFTNAGRFADGFAVASVNNKYGVLTVIDGDFEASLNGDNNVVKTGKTSSTFNFTLSVPESIAKQVVVKFDNGDGTLHNISLENNSYSFTPSIEDGAQDFTVRAQVLLDGLLLWEYEITQNLNNIQLDITVPYCDSEYADGNDIVRVKTIITNNSELAVSVSAYFMAKFSKESKNSMASKAYSSAKIAPGAEKEFYVDLKVVEAETVKVTVSVKANKNQYGAKSSTIEFKPFY